MLTPWLSQPCSRSTICQKEFYMDYKWGIAQKNHRSVSATHPRSNKSVSFQILYLHVPTAPQLHTTTRPDGSVIFYDWWSTDRGSPRYNDRWATIGRWATRKMWQSWFTIHEISPFESGRQAMGMSITVHFQTFRSSQISTVEAMPVWDIQSGRFTGSPQALAAESRDETHRLCSRLGLTGPERSTRDQEVAPRLWCEVNQCEIYRELCLSQQTNDPQSDAVTYNGELYGTVQYSHTKIRHK